ncbi:MAG: hypothetical protein U9R26_08235 [Campylobacterota bacterium]|nr:hypothetical protein [Campylobacterota bacterium]
MKQKKLVIIFLIVSLLCISPLPIFNLSLLYQKGELSTRNITTQKLFVADHFEASINYFAYHTLYLSLNKKQTIAGKDGFLFLGNQYADIIDKTQGLYPYKQEDIDLWVEKLKSVEDWYEAKGIQFIFVIVPNKSSIYPENLPASILYKEGETITDDIVRASRKKNIALLDLRDILNKSKGEDELYFRTDTHWNNKGASIGFEEAIHFLNTQYGEGYKLPKYTLQSIRRGSGDLAGFLKIKEILSPKHEKDFAFDFNRSVKVCHGNINLKKLAVEACKMRGNPILNIFAQDQYMINRDAVNPQKLLFIGDSFSTANSKLYNAAFGTLWKFHHSRIYGKKIADFIAKNQPDIVIYQIVERDLYSQTFVEPLY